MNKIIIFFSGLFLLAGHAIAAEKKETLHWYLPDYPPTFFLEGSSKGKGIVDKFVKGVMDHMDGYDHHVVTANMKRIAHGLKHEELVCGASLFKTPEREEFITFSIPFMYVFPAGIVYRKEDAEKFQPLIQDDGSISFAQLLSQGELVFGFPAGRSYHPALDPLISEKANAKNSERYYKMSISKGILDLLKAKRFDYTIGFTWEGKWFEWNNDYVDELEYRPFTEVQTLQYNYFGCSKTPKGRKAIEAINAGLEKMRFDPYYYSGYLNWISERERARYGELLKGGFPQ